MLDRIIAMNFPKEEDMIKFFDQAYRAAIQGKKYQWFKKKNNKSNINDPMWAEKDENYLKDKSFERGGKSMFLDEWISDKKNLLKEWERQ